VFHFDVSILPNERHTKVVHYFLSRRFSLRVKKLRLDRSRSNNQHPCTFSDRLRLNACVVNYAVFLVHNVHEKSSEQIITFFRLLDLLCCTGNAHAHIHTR
jgi:hypothetical protein